MKTNQKVIVDFGVGTLEIGHKDLMGSLTDLTIIGNKMRIEEGKPTFNMAQFLKKKATKSYIEHLKKDENIITPLKIVGAGSNKKTLGHLYLIIYIAQNMSDRFTTKIIKTFLKDELLKLRNKGGDDFKKLNVLIDTLTDRKGKNNKGCYIQIAKLIREKIFSKENIEQYGNNFNIWNSKIATSKHQLLRTEYEDKLSMLISLKYITTYSELKEAIQRLHAMGK